MVRELTHHYVVVHKKSTSYYPQENGLVESRNKTLQTILIEIVNENRTDWDTKLHSALWAYRTSYKTSIQSTPFRLAFGLEAVMPMEFQVPSLRIPLDRPVLDSWSGKQHVSTRHPGRGSATTKGKWVSIKTLPRAYAT